MTHFKMQQAVLRWATGKDMVQYFHVQKSKKTEKKISMVPKTSKRKFLNPRLKIR